MKSGGPLKRYKRLETKTPMKRGGRIRTKLTPIKSLKRRAWKAVSAFIRKRDPYCVTCLKE